MTNIYTGYGNSPLITSMLDSKKGSFGNRVDCTIHRAANTARGTVEIGALGAATYAGYKAINAAPVNKLAKFNGLVNKVLKKGAVLYNQFSRDIGKDAKSLTGIKKYATKAFKGVVDFIKGVSYKLSKTTGKQKLLGLLGIAALTTLVAIERKHAFKEGEYEQKYNDIAKRQY